MKLTSNMFLSLDGVYQGPGAPDEDRSGGFDRGGWLAPHFEAELGKFVDETFETADAFLLGRRTYEIFVGYWPKVTDPDHLVARSLNRLPKYVVSSTMRTADWQNTTILGGDVASQVAKLKSQPGRDLQVHGSGELVRFLLANDLLDELRLMVFPVIVGAGMRLFPEEGIATGLTLDESRTTPSGVTISVYRPSGRPEFGTVG